VVRLPSNGCSTGSHRLLDGWVFARTSPAEPVLSFRFESSSWTNLYRLVWRFCDALDDEGDALWARYEAAMGSQCPLD